MATPTSPRRCPFAPTLALAWALSIVGPGDLAGQAAPTPVPPPAIGERIQIDWVDAEGVSHRTRGRLMGTTGAELAVEGPDREVTVVPFDRVESLRRRAGVHPALGAMLGTALGVAAGAALAPDCSTCLFDGRAAMIAIGGGFVGAFVGYGIMDAQAWKDAPLPGDEPSTGSGPVLLGVDRLEASSGVSLRVGLRVSVGR